MKKGILVVSYKLYKGKFNKYSLFQHRWMRESIISSFQYQEAKAKNELNEEKIIQLKKKERNANKIIIELIMVKF